MKYITIKYMEDAKDGVNKKAIQKMQKKR